jgi:hypothetical protein
MENNLELGVYVMTRKNANRLNGDVINCVKRGDVITVLNV